MRGIVRSIVVLSLPMLALLVSVEASPAAFRVDVDARAADLQVLPAEGRAQLSLPGAGLLRQTGRPALPARAFTFAVGDDETVVGATLEGGRWVQAALTTTPDVIVPLEPFEARGLAEEHPFEPTALSRAASFPPVRARLVADRTWHGQRLVTVEAYPVRFDADGSVWVLEDATLVVETGAAAPRDEARRERRSADWATTTEELLRREVENPGDVRVDAGNWVDPRYAPQASAAAGPSLESAPVEHLIITSEALRPAFERLAAHRLRMGMPSLVVTVDEILAVTRQGVDTAETIRNYVRDAYELWGVDYLLIGGDTEIVPTRYCRNTFYPTGSYTDIPTDLYYGGLDGNWNDDGDGIFGEHYRSSVDRGDDVDFDAEIDVGRAPVTTPAVAEAFVDKVIGYEIPIDTTYQTSALIASEVLFPVGWEQGEPLQLDGAFLAEGLIDSALSCPTDPWTIDRMYEIPESYPGSQSVSPGDVIDALNSGEYGVFHHVGHGFYFNMSVGPGAIVPADADGLTNAPNFFLLYSLNCSSSAYDFNCLNERFVNNPNGGAVASLGSSRAAFPSAAGPLQEEFYEDWLCDGQLRIGDVFSASRAPFLTSTLYNTVQRWTQMVYALLGDPAMALFREDPEILQVFGPSSVQLGNVSGSVFALDGQGTPMEGLTVTAVKDGEDYFVGTTDAGGSVALDFEPETLGSIEVWVSGEQVKPVEISVDVVDGGFAVATVASWTVDDDATAPSDGNGNGRIEAGETVVLTPTIRNGAASAHPGGDILLTSASASVTIVDGVSSFGALAPGATGAADPVVIDVDANAVDGERVELVFGVDDALDRAVEDVEVIVLGTPQLEVVALRFDDGNDGTWNPGETADVVLTVKNYGSGAGGVLTGSLAVVAGTATLIDDQATWTPVGDVLGSADNAGDPFRVSLGGASGDLVLEATLTDDQGRTLVHTFDIVAPGAVSSLELASAGSGQIQIQWAEPSVADLHGYRVYRRADGVGSYELATPDVLVGSATYFDDGLAPLTTFEYVVAAVDQSGNEGPLSSGLSASTNPPELDCFPLPLGLETSGALAISDVNSDGIRDMVIGAETVYVIDGQCKEPLDGDNDAQTFGPIYDTESRFGPASITLGELDPSHPGLEIVTMNRDTRELLVMDDLGNVLPGWPVVLANWAWGSAVVGDVDGDGTPTSPDNEIVINDLNGYTYVFHHDGTELADGDGDPATTGPIAPRRRQTVDAVQYTEFFGRTTPALYDVDGNGTLEILFGSKYQNANAPEFFYALRVDVPGTNAAGWPKEFAPRSEFLSSPTIADLDGDGMMEIIAHSENDQLYVWELDGTDQPGFPVTLPTSAVNFDGMTPSPAVGNFDADADLEFVAVGITRTTIDNQTVYRSTLKIFDPDGGVLPGWPVVLDDLSECSPVVGDLDGDGSLDVVYGIGGTEVDDALFAFSSSGEDLRGFPIPINGFVRATPSLTDFDSSGTLDLALATWDRLIHVWDTGAPYDRDMTPWPTFRGNVSRTGVYGERIATSAPDGNVPGGSGRARMAAATPNPFNPQTKIAFDLVRAANDVRLTVYDVNGRHVRTLVTGAFDAGPHAVVWSGVDGQNQRVASGVYYAVLEVDGERVDARKMALVK